jgi:hypothetical protein
VVAIVFGVSEAINNFLQKFSVIKGIVSSNSV